MHESTHNLRRATRGKAIVVALLVAFLALAGCSQMGGGETDSGGTVEQGAGHVVFRPSASFAEVAGEPTSTAPQLQAGVDLNLEGLREPYDDTSDDTTVTVMMYFIGSNLETYDGSASTDVMEMLEADLGDNINIVIETGGSEHWNFSQYLDPYLPARWVIQDGHLEMVGVGAARSMTTTDELSDFVSWANESYPADRTILILWDHGGGTVGGFGSDELYPFSDSLSLADMREALLATGVTFNFVGFDACLMGTVECAWAMEPVADYLIASEEVEPGLGWSYTQFLTELSANPAISTPELAKTLVSNFIDDCQEYGIGDLTLSCMDLREISHVYEQLVAYLGEARAAIEADNTQFSELSRARSSAKEFSDGDIDQIDIIDFVSRTDFAGADELIAAIRSCVKYSGSAGITGANGMAMYFPYSDMRDYQSTTEMLASIGFTEPLSFYDYFVAVMGQSPSGASETARPPEGESEQPETTTPVDESTSTDGEVSWAEIVELLMAHGTPSQIEELLQSLNFNYEQTVVDAVDESGELPLVETQEGMELQLTEAQWATVSSVQISAVLVDGDDLIRLGTDNALSHSSSGNLLITTGHRWLGINGMPVAYQSHTTEVRDDALYYSGSVPALLNGSTSIFIELEWPLLDEAGNAVDGSPVVAHVLGYRLEDEVESTLGRGYHQFVPGDSVEFLFQRYNSDGTYDSSITLGPAYVVRSQQAMTFNYIDLYELDNDWEIACWGRVTDIYQSTVNTVTVWE